MTEWTKTKPTEPNWYWTSDDPSGPTTALCDWWDKDDLAVAEVAWWAEASPPPEPPAPEPRECDRCVQPCEKLHEAKLTIARLRAEVKRKTQDECGVWHCEVCSNEPEPPADGPYAVRYDGCEYDELRFVEGGSVMAVSGDVRGGCPWNKTTIDWSKARRLVYADEVAAEILRCAWAEFNDRLTPLEDIRTILGRLADEVAGGEVPMVRADAHKRLQQECEELRQQVGKLQAQLVCTRGGWVRSDNAEHERKEALSGIGRRIYDIRNELMRQQATWKTPHGVLDALDKLITELAYGDLPKVVRADEVAERLRDIDVTGAEVVAPKEPTPFACPETGRFCDQACKTSCAKTGEELEPTP